MGLRLSKDLSQVFTSCVELERFPSHWNGKRLWSMGQKKGLACQRQLGLMQILLPAK